jgi:hypothetical protein
MPQEAEPVEGPARVSGDALYAEIEELHRKVDAP